MTCMYICIANLILKFGFRLLVKDLQPHHNLHLEPQGLAGDLVGHCEKKMKRLFEVWHKAVVDWAIKHFVMYVCMHGPTDLMIKKGA